MEFALLLPVMLLLLFGMIETGFLVAQKLALGNAARQGARYGTIETNSGAPTCADIGDRVREAARAPRMNPGAVTVEVLRGSASGGMAAAADPCSSGPPCTGSAFGDQLFVTSSFQGRLDIPAPVFGMDRAVTLTSTGVFRCEYS